MEDLLVPFKANYELGGARGAMMYEPCFKYRDMTNLA